MNLIIIIIIIIRVFCPRAVPSLNAQEPRLHFCRRQVFHRKLRNQGCSFTKMNRCGSFPFLSKPHSLFSIWTDLKRSEMIPGEQTWRWGKWIWLTVRSGLHRYSLQGLNISSIRVFDQIRDSEIPITLRPLIKESQHNYKILWSLPSHTILAAILRKYYCTL